MSLPASGFRFLVCPDSRLLRSFMDEQPADFAGKTIERHVYWGDEEPPPRFWEQLTLQGLFGAPRILVARQAHLWPAATWKKISKALARPSDQCLAYFCLEVNWEKGQPKIPAHIAKLPCIAFADQQGWIRRDEGLTERNLGRYVRERAAALKLEFDPDALTQFCAAVPPDAQAVDSELEKLRLYRNALLAGSGPDVTPDSTAGIGSTNATSSAGSTGRITAAMTSTAAWSPECNVFALIRSMEAGNMAAVCKELARGRKDCDSLLFSLLALLARELRLLWQVSAGESVRLHPADASAKKQLAIRLGPSLLADAMSLVVDAEFQVKSGRRSPEQSLDHLTARLTGLFRA